MRSSKSRSRSKHNRHRSVGNIVNRVFDSSGPEGKVRGTPQQIIEKYNQLGRDSQLSNDRVAAENFQQHAEHYLRLLGEALREQELRREQVEKESRERQLEREREKPNKEINHELQDQTNEISDRENQTNDQNETPKIPRTREKLGLDDERNKSVSESGKNGKKTIKSSRRSKVPKNDKLPGSEKGSEQKLADESQSTSIATEGTEAAV